MAGVFVAAAGAQATPTVPVPAPVTTTNADGTIKTTTQTTTDANGRTSQSVGTSVTFNRGKKKTKDDKIQQTKDSRKAEEKARSAQALVGVDSRLPDKQLYDKAVVAMNKGHFDVARLDLQTMLNTYPDSQYQMRAKLAIADSWYKEGGTAALTQAESEYADFRVFFPNAPEAAEAQMRIGDIYFRQMDRPDRDYNKAVHSEEEYRRMLTDYPDSVLIPQAKQRLREVQEVMASREADIASFYGTRGNFSAEIARYQTVVDTYPLYSHMDDVLIGLGDAYVGEAKYIRTLQLPPQASAAQREAYESGKAILERQYEKEGADQYRKVVLEHSASRNVEDARDRLAAMDLPIPVPTPEQVAASEKLENSRATYKLADRARLMFMKQADVVLAARDGEPSMVDPKQTSAPTIARRVGADFATAFRPVAAGAAPAVEGTAPGAASADAAVASAPPVAEAPVAAAPPAAAPLQLQDVPAADAAGGASPAVDLTVPAGSGTGPGGAGVGIEVLPSGSRPAVDTGGLPIAAPKNTAALPPLEKPEVAPDQINDAAGQPTAPAQVVAAGKKAPKPEFDKADESSSRHKPKKGIKKVIPPNPF